MKDDDSRMAGERVLIQVWDSLPGRRSIELPNGREFAWIETERFVPVRRIDVVYDSLPAEARAGDTLRLRFRLDNPYPYDYRFDGDSVSLSIVWRNRNEPTHRYVLPEVTGLLPAGGSMTAEARFVVPPLAPRRFEVGFTVADLPVTTWFNGRTTGIRIVE